jgi:heat shock protein HslJ
MRPYSKALILVAVSLFAIGCGESNTTTAGTVAAGTSCGQLPGVPGEIVVVQAMKCSDAVDVAQAYFRSGQAPGYWNSAGPSGSKGWQCDGRYRGGKRPVIARCGSYSTAGSAQRQLAKAFEVRPHASAPHQPDELWGREFTSTAVTEDGEPRPLVRGTRISLGFKRYGGRHGMAWEAGCNGAGADVQITADKLLVVQISSTAIGCPAELQTQDEWLGEFFSSDPSWRLSDSTLTLTSGETVIELEETDR